jgi:leucyl-tRNA synthetase
MPYDPSFVEPKWQRVWRESAAFRTPPRDQRPKYYVLDMFPYPSGRGLHVGHLKGYVASDVVARYKRMRGFDVLHPMGWDSFGLPAERQAEREGAHPADVTARNIATFKHQLEIVGLSYDWEREVATSDPSYFRWTQWIFVKLLEAGLAYQADVPVNWCPALGTVLANEEVDEEGRYVETGDPVERRVMRQWMLRITAYADRLLDGLDLVDWPEDVKKLQRNWIGPRGGPYNLHDWLFSRQRYWGEPIPVVFGPNGEVEPEPSLPLVLPEKPSERTWAGDGEVVAPLAHAREWVETRLPSTGAPARRETNVMPQWAGSSWYFLRFADPTNQGEPWSREAERAWMPVDLYVGGVEHATLHLLYARFWHKFFHDLGLVSTEEPFQRLFNQGKVHARSFRDQQGRYHAPDEVVEHDGSWRTRICDLPVTSRMEKMSKSKRNGVDPEPIVRSYGADSLRVYEMFLGPLEANVVWQDEGIVGARRFLDRVWRVLEASLAAPGTEDNAETERLLHRTIKKITDGIEALRLNTAVSELMIFTNHATARGRVSRRTLERFARLLAPFAPHVAEEMWEALEGNGLVAHAPWPDYDEALAGVERVAVAVQVDGRFRARVEIAAGSSENAVREAALADEAVQRAIGGREISRVVYVAGKAINFVK